MPPRRRQTTESPRIRSRVMNHRWERRVSQTTVAQALGISRFTLSNIERGLHEPSVYLALRLAKYFSTTVEKLFEI